MTTFVVLQDKNPGIHCECVTNRELDMAAINLDDFKTTRQIADAYPHVFTVTALQWHARNRDKNGLTKRGICFKGPGKALLWHERKLMEWRAGQLS